MARCNQRVRFVHHRFMQLAGVMLVLLACGGTQPVVVANRGGTTLESCPFKSTFDVQARRYGNLDADDPSYQRWEPWRLHVELAGEDRPQGTAVLTGPTYDMKLRVTGKLDLAACELTLESDSHDIISLRVKFRDAITGEIRSIDDGWLLGPPFPAKR